MASLMLEIEPEVFGRLCTGGDSRIVASNRKSAEGNQSDEVDLTKVFVY